MNRIKLTIHNGHRNAQNGQTGTSGILPNGTKIYEVDLIDSIFYKIKEIIDRSSYLSSRIELSYDDATIKNGARADYFVALHIDGSSDPTKRGGFVDNHPNDYVYDKSMAFAKKVADTYFPQIDIPYINGQTQNTTYYYAFVITGLNTKQFIIELGRMTNSEDLNRLVNVETVGQLLVDGMVRYFEENEEIFKSIPGNNTTGGLTEEKKKVINERITRIQEQSELILAKQDEALIKALQDTKALIAFEIKQLLEEIKKIVNSA